MLSFQLDLREITANLNKLNINKAEVMREAAKRVRQDSMHRVFHTLTPKR